MPLTGDAFMIVAHDTRAEAKPAYHLCHMREHMLKRVGV